MKVVGKNYLCWWFQAKWIRKKISTRFVTTATRTVPNGHALDWNLTENWSDIVLLILGDMEKNHHSYDDVCRYLLTFLYRFERHKIFKGCKSCSKFYRCSFFEVSKIIRTGRMQYCCNVNQTLFVHNVNIVYCTVEVITFYTFKYA